MDFRKAFATVVTLGVGVLPAAAEPLGSRGSFPLHDEFGGATLIEITGVNSATARMVGEFTPADILEMCQRIGWRFYSPSFPFRGAFEDTRTIQICRDREEAKSLELRRYTAEANCLQRTLKMPSGYTVALRGAQWQTETGRALESEFSPGHLKTVEKQFAMLCPAAQPNTEGGGSIVQPR